MKIIVSEDLKLNDPKRLLAKDAKDMINIREHSMDLKSNDEMIQSLNKDGIIIDVSPGWLEKMGYDKEDVVGRFFGEFLIDKSIQETKTAFPHLKDYGFVDNVSLMLKRKDGVVIQAALNGTTQYSPEGEVQRTFCELRTLDYYMQSVEAISRLIIQEKFLKMIMYLKANITSLLLVKTEYDYLEVLSEILVEPTDINEVVVEPEPQNISLLDEKKRKLLSKGKELVEEFGYLTAGKVLVVENDDTRNQANKEKRQYTMVINIDDDTMENNERMVCIEFRSSEEMLKDWKNASVNISRIIESVIQSIRTNEENIRLIKMLKSYHN